MQERDDLPDLVLVRYMEYLAFYTLTCPVHHDSFVPAGWLLIKPGAEFANNCKALENKWLPMNM